MSSLMALRFIHRIHNPGIVPLREKIETTFALSSPPHASDHEVSEPKIRNPAPVGRLVHNLFLSVEKSSAPAATDSLRLKPVKFARVSLTSFLRLRRRNSQGKKQAASCLVQETQDRLETVEEDLDDTFAGLAELRITLQNEQAACCTLQGHAETEASQHQSRLDVLRAECSTTKEGFVAKDKQITEARIQLARKPKELDEAHNDWHTDKEDSNWLKKRWEEAREDLEAANDEINALNGELDQKNAMITRRELKSLQEEFRARQNAEEDAQRLRGHIETLYKELDESSEEVENCYMEIKDTLLRLDAAEDKASLLCAWAEEKDVIIETLQVRLDQANDDLEVAEEAHISDINTLTGQFVQKDSMLSVARINLHDTKADLEAAYTTVCTLSVQLSDKITALSYALDELTKTQVAFKIVEDKPCAKGLSTSIRSHSQTPRLSNSRGLVQHGQLIAHLTEREDVALKDVSRLEATNRDLNDRIVTLEAQLSSIATAPSSDLTAIKATEVIKADLTRAFGQECDAHDATRKDVQSLQTRPAVASKDLKVAKEKIESLQSQMESREVEYHALEQKVLEVVAEMNKENAQLGQSKKSIEELLVSKVDRCDRLEKENMSLRALQSNPTTPLLSSFQSHERFGTISPCSCNPEEGWGGSWFNGGVFSPNVRILIPWRLISHNSYTRLCLLSPCIVFVLAISYSFEIAFCPSGPEHVQIRWP
ncbi:hypothetical protein NLI96_g5820 [Meripilus lineatus]|uniref:Uncharacterized protein n=1 Tax=Meripilus lineatus TaxID=2056292 RepID=A0AAD5V4F7_9APHY|nr:hypothetical protein NLI96_g5820 [Physisporinus lineatus]